MAALMMELTQSRVCGTGMKVFTFAFDMFMTLHMAVSHSLCEVLICGPGCRLGGVEWPNDVDRDMLNGFLKVGHSDFKFG